MYEIAKTERNFSGWASTVCKYDVLTMNANRYDLLTVDLSLFSSLIDLIYKSPSINFAAKGRPASVRSYSLLAWIDLCEFSAGAVVQIIIIPKAKGGDSARIIYNYFRAMCAMFAPVVICDLSRTDSHGCVGARTKPILTNCR